MIKHYEKTTFKNAAGYWTVDNLKLRSRLERIQPNVNIGKIVGRALRQARVDKYMFGTTIASTIAGRLSAELNQAIASTGKTTKHSLIMLGSYDIPVKQKTGRKKSA
jgi:hypothetical protein